MILSIYFKIVQKCLEVSFQYLITLSLPQNVHQLIATPIITFLFTITKQVNILPLLFKISTQVYDYLHLPFTISKQVNDLLLLFIFIKQVNDLPHHLDFSVSNMLLPQSIPYKVYWFIAHFTLINYYFLINMWKHFILFARAS